MVQSPAAQLAAVRRALTGITIALTDLKLHRSLQRLVDEGVSIVDRMHPVHPDTRNVVIGSIVVAMFAWVEQNAKPNWGALHDPNQPKLFPWLSWGEFVNLHKIRHCFAHRMDGTMLANYAGDIEDFQHSLSSKKVRYEWLNGKIEIVEPYYAVANGKLLLDPSTVHRTMQLTIWYWSKATGTPIV